MASNDKFGYHELLHTAHIMACMWEDHILGHGAIADDAKLLDEALRISLDLGSFYQKVAAVSDEKFKEELQ
jgi:hypothetical protein